MAQRKFAQLILTCKDKSEADKIANALLEGHLVACAKFLPIESMYWWHDTVESSTEIMLLMESAEDLFDAVEAVVSKLHSYDTFLLQAVPFGRISTEAVKWLNNEIRHG